MRPIVEAIPETKAAVCRLRKFRRSRDTENKPGVADSPRAADRGQALASFAPSATGLMNEDWLTGISGGAKLVTLSLFCVDFHSELTRKEGNFR
jgi:hypothetical protein